MQNMNDVRDELAQLCKKEQKENCACVITWPKWKIALAELGDPFLKFLNESRQKEQDKIGKRGKEGRNLMRIIA